MAATDTLDFELPTALDKAHAAIDEYEPDAIRVVQDSSNPELFDVVLDLGGYERTIVDSESEQLAVGIAHALDAVWERGVYLEGEQL